MNIYCFVQRLHSHTQNARLLTCIAVKGKKHKYTKEDEDVYIAVVMSIRLMALMHLLYFDEIQAFYDTRMNDAIMIIIMKNCNDFQVH